LTTTTTIPPGSMIPSYIRNAHATILVYDICGVYFFKKTFMPSPIDRKTFEGIPYWTKKVLEEQAPKNMIKIFLVGNKSDNQKSRCATTCAFQKHKKII
jgi:GTPase SAR1 family protein